jgi:hypothetical protein
MLAIATGPKSAGAAGIVTVVVVEVFAVVPDTVIGILTLDAPLSLLTLFA